MVIMIYIIVVSHLIYPLSIFEYIIVGLYR